VVGDAVVAIGSPEDLAFTVTSGIVSALNRDCDRSHRGADRAVHRRQWRPAVPFSFGGQQYNAAPAAPPHVQGDPDRRLAQPGNSGGGLFDIAARSSHQLGDVLGLLDSSGSTSDSAGSVGLGFAIRSTTVKSDLSYLQGGGDSN